MPRVPTYERRVRPAALPSARIEARRTPESEGAGVARAKAAQGEAVAHLGAVTADAGVRAFTAEYDARQDREDAAIFLASSRQLAELEHTMTYGDQGYLAAQGLDAQAAREKVRASFDEQAGLIVGQARNDRQRVAIQRAIDARRASIDDGAARHAEQQLTTFYATETAAFLKVTGNSAVAHAQRGDLPRARMDLESGEAALKDFAARNPQIGPETLKQQLEEFRTGVHSGVIDALLQNKQDGLARIYYEEAKPEIAGGAQRGIEEKLEEGTLRGVGQQVTDAIVAAGGTVQEQRAKVRAISDEASPLPGDVAALGVDRARLRDDVEQRFEQQYARAQREEAEALEQLVDQAYNAIDDQPELGTDAVPVGDWRKIPGPTREALTRYAANKVEGRPVKTNLLTYAAQVDLAAKDPATFIDPAKNNLNALRDKLSPTDFKELVDLRARLIRGEQDAASKQVRGLRGAADIVEETFRQHGFDTSNTKDNRAGYERFIRFRKAVDDKIQLLGGLDKVSPDQVQKIVDELLIEVTIPHPGGGMLGGLFPDWWNRSETKPAFEVTPADLADISAADRAAIVNGLRQRGLPVTDANIVQAYIRAKGTRK
jgi:hypothetical protein